MRRLGKVLHLSKSSNLIVRLETSQPPPVGASVCDYKLRKVGFVNNILGPVKAPYASVQPTVESPGTQAGRIVYLVEK